MDRFMVWLNADSTPDWLAAAPVLLACLIPVLSFLALLAVLA